MEMTIEVDRARQNMEEKCFNLCNKGMSTVAPSTVVGIRSKRA